MYKTILAVLVFTVIASGCTVKARGVKVSAPGVEVGLSGGSGHCPPGQAKKGNC